MSDQNTPAWIVAFSNDSAYVVEAIKEEDILSNPIRALKIGYDPGKEYIPLEQRAQSMVDSERSRVNPELFMDEKITVEDLLQNPCVIEKGYQNDDRSREYLEFQMLAFHVLTPNSKQKEIRERKRIEGLTDDELFQEELNQENKNLG